MKSSVPICIVVALVIAMAMGQEVFAQYTQWGGPKQDFKVKSKGISLDWPDGGPPKLWSRDIGEGYSGILVRKGRLYTMSREEEEEVVLCLDAKTGKTIWKCSYEAPAHEKHEKNYNSGPRGTPAISGKYLYTIGCSGKMHCLKLKTGKVVWSHDLWGDMGGTFLNHGYSSSPYVYKDTVIAMVGGEGHSIVAFDGKTGKVAWKKHDFRNSYSTPKLIDVNGQEQLLCFMASELIGISPEDGELYWSFSQENQWKQNITMPVWSKKSNILFISSVNVGSKGLKLKQEAGKTEVEELWHNRKVGLHHSNAIRVGKFVYCSTGRPSVFQAIDIRTGECAWRERGFAKSTCLHVDGKFLILDENGSLGLATATPDFFEIHAKIPILKAKRSSKTWTVPTLSGQTLFLRDCRKIMALALAGSSE